MTSHPRLALLTLSLLCLTGCSASQPNTHDQTSPTRIIASLLSHTPQAIGCLHEQAGQSNFQGSCQGLTTNLHALTTQALQAHVFQTPLNLQIQPGSVAWSTTLGSAAGEGLHGAQVHIELTQQDGELTTACTLSNHQLGLASTVALTALGCKTN